MKTRSPTQMVPTDGPRLLPLAVSGKTSAAAECTWIVNPPEEGPSVEMSRWPVVYVTFLDRLSRVYRTTATISPFLVIAPALAGPFSTTLPGPLVVTISSNRFHLAPSPTLPVKPGLVETQLLLFAGDVPVAVEI